ncbi:hypothetical protein D9M70_581310 [compost metagenome]
MWKNGRSPVPALITMTLIRAAEVCATAPTGKASGRRSTPQTLAITSATWRPESCSQAWLSWRGNR